MAPHKIKEIGTTADVHAENPVSNFNSTITSGERRLESDSQKARTKKLKPDVDDNYVDSDDIIRLADSTPCKESTLNSPETNTQSEIREGISGRNNR